MLGLPPSLEPMPTVVGSAARCEPVRGRPESSPRETAAARTTCAGSSGAAVSGFPNAQGGPSANRMRNEASHRNHPSSRRLERRATSVPFWLRHVLMSNEQLCSDADPLCEQLAVVRGVAEEDLGALGPLEIQVRVVLPREADAAVDLDVLGGGVEVRVGAVGL